MSLAARRRRATLLALVVALLAALVATGPGPAAQAAADLEPVQPRQHHIQHDQVGVDLLRDQQGARSVGRDPDLKSGPAERVAQGGDQARLVVDEQDAVGHTREARRPR